MQRSVRISPKNAKALVAFLERMAQVTDEPPNPAMSAVLAELRRGLAVKPAVRAARKVREAKRADHAEETSEVYDAVMARAGRTCEACGQPSQQLDELQLDHFFGRVRAKQSPETTWAIHRSCHRSKTANKPDAAYWLRLFVAHCTKHGFLGSLRMAEGKLEANTIKARLTGGSR